MANVRRPDFDDSRDEVPGYRARRARVGAQVGARRLGASLWELDAGETAYPYHLHLGEEELLLVLDGRPTLRTPEGERVLEAGELVSFPAGASGAHQMRNDSDALVRFLAVSTNGAPDVVLYPDEGKLCAAERAGDGRDGLRVYFRSADEVPYWDGIVTRS